MDIRTKSVMDQEVDLKALGKHLLKWACVLVSGVSIVYVISAGLVLMGVQRMMPDFQVHDGNLLEKLSPIGAIHLYELALLGVLAIVAIWKKVYDDAISLVMLSTLFMIAGAATLNMIPHEFWLFALGLGFMGIALAAIKIWLLWPRVVGRVSNLVLAGLGLLITTSFLIPGVLANRVDHGMVNSQMLPYWLVGWWIWLAGAALVVAGSVTEPSGAWQEDDRQKPFLRTSVMRWILVAIVLIASAAHQLGVTWVIALPLGWGDLSPAGALAWLLWLDVRRVYRGRWMVLDYLPGLMLMGLIFGVTGSRSYHFGPAFGPEYGFGLVSYPPLVAILTGLGVTGLALRSGWRSAYFMTTLFIALGVILWGNTPDALIDFRHENLIAALTVLGAASMIAALVNRSFIMLGAAWIFIGLGEWTLIDLFSKSWPELRDIESASALLTTGLGLMLTAIAAGRRTPGAMVWAGSAIAFFGAWSMVNSGAFEFWKGPAWIGLLTVVINVLAAIRTRRPGVVTPTILATLWLIKQFCGTVNPGWLLVGAGFATLGIGATISVWRGNQRAGNPPSTTPPPAPPIPPETTEPLAG